MSASNPINTHDMLLIHRLIRRELGLLPGMIRRAGGNPPRAQRVARHVSEMTDFLHDHHDGEDTFLWPVLRTSPDLDTPTIERMETQHAHVAAALHGVQRDLPTWTTSADAISGETMAADIESMNEVLNAHLDEEETTVLPMVARTLTAEQWAQLAKHGFAAIPGKRRLVMLGHILEEASPEETKTFLLNVPPPARIAFKLIGRRQHAREVAILRT